MEKINALLQPVFENYRDKYIKVFRYLYPAKNSTGFPERNLSVNFSKAIEEQFPSAATWFEFQFGDKNNLHYDAVVVIPEIKTVLVVESKRFSNPAAKIAEIQDDMIRVNRVSTDYFHEFEERIKNFSEFAVFGVILADIWTETRAKTEIKNSFVDHDFIAKYIPTLEGQFFYDGTYYICDFKNTTSYKWLNENYYLVSMIWRIQNELPAITVDGLKTAT